MSGAIRPVLDLDALVEQRIDEAAEYVSIECKMVPYTRRRLSNGLVRVFARSTGTAFPGRTFVIESTPYYADQLKPGKVIHVSWEYVP